MAGFVLLVPAVTLSIRRAANVSTFPEYVLTLGFGATGVLVWVWILDQLELTTLKSKWVARGIWTGLVLVVIGVSADAYRVAVEDSNTRSGCVVDHGLTDLEEMALGIHSSIDAQHYEVAERRAGELVEHLSALQKTCEIRDDSRTSPD